MPPKADFVLMIIITIVLLGAGAVLWWKLSLALQQNTLLRAEVSKLRGRLRALLP